MPLRDFVQTKLTLRWSPEQISHALPIEFPGQRERHLVHQTIYQALYVQGLGELRRELTRALRTGRARRKPHRRPDARRQGCIVDPTVMISQRPCRVGDPPRTNDIELDERRKTLTGGEGVEEAPRRGHTASR